MDMQLENGIEASLCRRGRRRLKELQEGNPGAKVRLDRRRKVLRVTGTPEMIEAPDLEECGVYTRVGRGL